MLLPLLKWQLSKNMLMQPETSKSTISLISTGRASHATPPLGPKPLRKKLKSPGNFLQSEHLIIPSHHRKNPK